VLVLCFQNVVHLCIHLFICVVVHRAFLFFIIIYIDGYMHAYLSIYVASYYVRERGGIFRKDVDEASSWRVHRNQFTKKTNDGWCRITIFNGKLYVSHLGVGYGSRDGVWILALLDIMDKYKLPDVDFVLSSMDKRLCCHSLPFSYCRNCVINLV
jgi:hypothetical protein